VPILGAIMVKYDNYIRAFVDGGLAFDILSYKIQLDHCELCQIPKLLKQ